MAIFIDEKHLRVAKRDPTLSLEEPPPGESEIMLRSILAVLGVTVILFWSALPVAAKDPSALTGRIILTVGGAIDAKSNGQIAEFDLATLEGLGLKEIKTETPWSEGLVTFEGVLVRDLIAAVGASGDKMRAVALDDYSVSIPLEEFDQYDAILATRRDGDHMRVRDKGPVWLIYPWTDYPEIRNEEDYAKAIWQIRELTFE